MLARYASSYIRALLDTFPEIGLEQDKFKGAQLVRQKRAHL